MFPPGTSLVAALQSVAGPSEPSYVIALTVFNASVVAYAVAIHLRKVRRKQTKEKPGKPPQ